jgi:hypothetical protein
MADDKTSPNAEDMPETPQTESRTLQSGNLESQEPQNEISPVS